MSRRQRALLLVAVLASLVVVVAAGLTRASYGVADGEAPCPDRVLPSALRGLPDDSASPEYACIVESQERMYVVAGSLMGLVLISGLLSRRRE